MSVTLRRRVSLLALAVVAFGGSSGGTAPDPSSPDRTAAPSPAAPAEATYREVDGRTLKAYVFQPPAAGGSHPAILLFHGGAWRLGEPAWLFDRAREFAQGGMVAIAVQYRLSHDGLSPIDAVEDACAAFAWARESAPRYGIDAGRVAGYGVSAGGHLVAAAATLAQVRGRNVSPRERPDAMLLFSPALNMARDEYFMELMQGKGDPAAYSPLQFVTHGLPPTLITQGEEDTIVLTRDARAFCEAAEKAGARCDLKVYPKVGHLLTRNLKVQYRDFDQDPAHGADAHRREDAFLRSLGYLRE